MKASISRWHRRTVARRLADAVGDGSAQGLIPRDCPGRVRNADKGRKTYEAHR